MLDAAPARNHPPRIKPAISFGPSGARQNSRFRLAKAHCGQVLPPATRASQPPTRSGQEHLTSPGQALRTGCLYVAEQPRQATRFAPISFLRHCLYEMPRAAYPFAAKPPPQFRFHSSQSTGPLCASIPPASDWKKSFKQGAGERLNLRYQHASDMRADLQRLKRDTDSSAPPGDEEFPLAPKAFRLARTLLNEGAAMAVDVLTPAGRAPP